MAKTFDEYLNEKIDYTDKVEMELKKQNKKQMTKEELEDFISSYVKDADDVDDILQKIITDPKKYNLKIK